ncbi:hypothetical protein [Methylobacterium sp.]|uniref:HVO_A0114 family putative DNA-binding protein n=1 Tax=Methylobacterium sp. TaxID=409 RepID=UPI003B01A173
MAHRQIKGHERPRDEMTAAVKGGQAAPLSGGGQSFACIEALTRLLTPEKRELLAIILDRKPRSIAELATFSSRAAPNLPLTLAKLEAAGLMRMDNDHRRKVPNAIIHKLRVQIDPFLQNDQLEIA